MSFSRTDAEKAAQRLLDARLEDLITDEEFGEEIVELMGGVDALDLDTVQYYIDFKAFGQDLLDSGEAVMRNSGWLHAAEADQAVEIDMYDQSEISEVAAGIAKAWSDLMEHRTELLLSDKGYFTSRILEDYQDKNVGSASRYLTEEWGLPEQSVKAASDELILETALLFGYLEDRSATPYSVIRDGIQAFREGCCSVEDEQHLSTFANIAIQYDEIPFFEWSRAADAYNAVCQLGVEVFDYDNPDGLGQYNSDYFTNYFDYERFGAERADQSLTQWLPEELEKQANAAARNTPDAIASAAKDCASKAGVAESQASQIVR